MAIKPILKMGNPRLREKALPFKNEEILSSETKILIQDMFDTMKNANGLGLAATQIGVLKQVAIIELSQDNPRYKLSSDSQTYILFNPTIKIINENTQGFWEGCLSVPGMRGFVERPSKITVNYTDQFAKQHSIELEGFLATVFQHELDHLKGILYIDKIIDTKKLCFIEEFEKYWNFP